MSSYRDPLDEPTKDALRDGNEALTAEFRYKIGLLPEEEDGLTQAFKASIGLTGPEPVAASTEVDIALEKQYEATLRGFKFEKFAQKNFLGGQSAGFSTGPLQEPLLPKRHDIDRLCSLTVWLAIQRFMGDAPAPITSTKSRTPVMTTIYRKLDHLARRRQSSSDSSPDVGKDVKLREKAASKRKSWWKGSGKSTDKRGPPTEVATGPDINANDIKHEELPTGELDLIHYIVGHGILRRDLRDEIFCQLSKQLRSNRSQSSSLKGWILLALCSGCFTPSEQIANYVQSALRECPKDFKEYSVYTRRILKRTSMNGPRYHPPNWLEYQATKMRKYVMLPVALPDGRMQSLEADSAMTSGEICSKIATEIKLLDQFGFSLFITIFDKVSSLGSGLDHAMDAISECEQLMRTKSKREEDAPWRLYFRKESFVPWHNPEHCPVSSELVYKQISKGIRTEEYKTRDEDELVRFAARKWYVENGAEMIPGKLQSTLHTFLPRSALVGGRSRDGWIQAIVASFTEQGFDKQCVTRDQVKWHIVVSSPTKWPLQFAGLFEAFRLSGPRLPRDDVVIAVSGRGIFILDEPYKVVRAYRFYEVVEVFNRKSSSAQGPTLGLITIKGDEFTFLSPNSETIARLVGTFLDGLRQRSKVAVGLQEFFLEGTFEPRAQKVLFVFYSSRDVPSQTTFEFRQGDVIELLDDPPSRDDWVVGIVEKSKRKGEFPVDAVYILPSIETPPTEFLEMFRLMSAADASTLPRKRGAVKLESNSNRTATLERHGVESAA